MRIILIAIGCIAALIAATFLPQVKDWRAEKAYAYYQQGDLEKAKKFYYFGKLQGDLEAANNYHVLDYRLMRYDEATTDRAQVEIRLKTLNEFKALSKKGSTAATYNLGMFYFGYKSGTHWYAEGLNHFDFAAGAGDELSKYAAEMMRAKALDKNKKYRALRKSADDGNDWAAYRYAKSFRFDEKSLRGVEKYALQGAESGYADAQQYLASYYPRRKDAKTWLEKAANNPSNRSLMAASDLAVIAEKKRDFKARRKWLELASTPRKPFNYQLIEMPGGFRWRGLQSSILADANTSQSAAYDLAFMQMDGVGGKVDNAGAMKNLEYAGRWADASILLAELKSGRASLSNGSRKKGTKTPFNADLVRYDSRKNRLYYEKLRPYVKNKQIRYATETDLKWYANGVSMIYSNEKLGYKPWGKVANCKIGFDCFYMEKPIVLPKDMNGSHSATFIVSPRVFLPKQHLSHNKYIFMHEGNAPK